MEWRRTLESLFELHERFIQDLHALPPLVGTHVAVLPGWTTLQLVHHLAAWNWEAVRRLRAIHADTSLPDKKYDLDEFNAHALTARVEMSWEKSLDEFSASYQALRDLLNSHVHPDPPLDPRFQEWVVAIRKHLHDHLMDLRDALGDVSFGVEQGGDGDG
jgi:hypothetical protein